MDLRLPLLADANLHLGIAEEAANEAAWTTATYELEKAEEALTELREYWSEMDEKGKGLLAQLAKPLGIRAKELNARLPKLTAVSEGEAVLDDEQEMEPDDL